MACGVPVIASNIGGIPEVIRHDENGYLAELGDIQRMSKYAIELLNNTKKWQVFSEKAIESAHTNFNSNKIITKYLEVYQRHI